MYHVKTTREAGKLVSASIATEAEVKAYYAPNGHRTMPLESRNDWRTFEAAKEVAAALGSKYIATDAGAHVSPRYDITDVPEVGAPVSYYFNGDSYPCGHVKSVSAFPHKLITTTEGQKFYRVRETGCWKYAKTWSLQPGHVSKLNPEF